jgi:Fe-S oxidoreductase/FAD/FMN-containing dehydrogenase
MTKFETAHSGFLRGSFSDRVSFDRVERKLYGHDIAVFPSLFKPLIGKTLPDAIVQPESEQELIDLVKWAVKNSVPLTARGKASSGYGGVLPIKGGLVVDFYRMSKILAVDAERLTATIQAGVVWEKLDRELAKQELTLKLYPTSYPSSTAGGWLAQGGAGIGSYEAGWFRENVISARLVAPDGEAKEIAGPDLDLVADACGTTGFISEMTIRIQPREELEPIAIGTPTAKQLQQLAELVVQKNVPIWSLAFINPKMAELKNKTPLAEHNGHPAEERVLLPESYITIIAYRKKDRDAVIAPLSEIMKTTGSQLLDDAIAHHEWENRFKLMIVKRLGPSLVPAEVVIPLSSLGNALTEIEKKVKQPLVKEGVIIRKSTNGKPEVVILGFIPADQRKFSFNFVFGLVLTIIQIAENNGGRAYSTGLYFSTEADKLLGKDRADRIRAFKKKADPLSLMNPGKVVTPMLAAKAIGFARKFESFIRPFGNAVSLDVAEKPTKPVRDIPADIAWYAYGCSQCGYCIDQCDQFYGRGWESQSPRGKWYWLREYMEGREEWSQSMVDTMLVCTTCELCNARCSASLPIESSWMKLRGILIHEEKRMTFPPFEMMGAALDKEGNIWAGYRKDRDAWFPEDLKEKHGPAHKSETAYFAGCTASYVENDIAMASVRLLDAAGVDFTYVGKKENCCGIPMLVAGKWDLFAEVVKRNIQVMNHAGVKTVITSCPACNLMWRTVYASWAKKLNIPFAITSKHYSEVVAEKIASGEFKFPTNGNGNGKQVRVTWHDSCHLGRASGIYEPPRDVIKAIPNVDFVEMPYNREEAHCCGSVLTLIHEPNVAATIGKTRLDEAEEVGAEKVLALCPCCQFQLRVAKDNKNSKVEVQDLAHFAAAALGFEFPNPHPEALRQWAVFDAMIKLMTPEGFADLMGSMWPELIDAMPFGMGPMMRMMGKVPGALTMMKPMFPILFPRLLPMMMPKVMPTMLARVADQVPVMPDYMKEQMPELMPKVMDELMPHMIRDVVPLVTQPMINYLQGKN